MLGTFCFHCGQKAEHRIVPLRALASEVVEDLLSLDNRLIRTLRPLLFRPGSLTTRYIEGQRVRYMPPFRLYLIASVLYFAVLALTGSETFFFFRPSPESEQADRFIRLLPRLMFVILPAFALLLKGLYLRTRRLYVEHLIFALYFHAFAFLVLAVHTLLEWYIQGTWEGGEMTLLITVLIALDVLLQLWVFAYLYGALRTVYGQTRAVTALKSFLLLAGYLGLLILAGTAILQLTWLLAWMV